MIKKVSNSVLTKSSNVTLTGGGKPKSVPAINSLVLVTVVGREGRSYRILVNGSLFQTTLPFLLEAGEEFLAKVLMHKPFTLAVDSFTSTKEIDQSVLSIMLARLGVEESELSKKILKAVIKSKKALVKSKLKRLVEYLNYQNIYYDEIQIALLLNVVWSTGKENYEDIISSFSRIFDISFEELSKAILALLERLNSIDSRNTIVNKFNETLIYQSENPNAKSNISAVTDKSKGFIELSQMIDASNNFGMLGTELNVMQALMLKYIMQKSMFNMFRTFPEFIIVNSNDMLEIIIVRYDKLESSKGELLHKISSEFHINTLGDFGFRSYLSDTKLNGDVILDIKNMKHAESKINLFNEQLSDSLKIDSAVRISLKGKYKNISQNHFDGISTINAIA